MILRLALVLYLVILAAWLLRFAYSVWRYWHPSSPSDREQRIIAIATSTPVIRRHDAT